MGQFLERKRWGGPDCTRINLHDLLHVRRDIEIPAGDVAICPLGSGDGSRWNRLLVHDVLEKA